MQTLGGDFVHFVPVHYVPGRDLYLNASSVGNDFVWVPVSRYPLTLAMYSWKESRQNINRGVLAMLRAYLPTAISQLSGERTAPAATPSPSAAAAAPTVSATAPSGRVNWLTIPNAILLSKGEARRRVYKLPGRLSAEYSGKIWPTSEHYFQAQKFVGNPMLQEQIRTARSPRDAFTLARANSASVRKDWDNARFDAMIKALRAKFTQHSALQRMLLSTSTKTLVENAGANDKFWGAGDGSGNNLLGQMLMHVREELSTVSNHLFFHSIQYNNNLRLLRDLDKKRSLLFNSADTP